MTITQRKGKARHGSQESPLASLNSKLAVTKEEIILPVLFALSTQQLGKPEGRFFCALLDTV